MKNFISIVLMLFITQRVVGQESYSIKPLFDLNSQYDELACAVVNDQLIVMKAQAPDAVSDYQWTERPKYFLQSWERGVDYSKWSGQKLFFRSALQDVGPASYSADDSLLFFSSIQNFGRAKGNS
jgi:hypothetical protein